MKGEMAKRYVFLDRGGVINKDSHEMQMTEPNSQLLIYQSPDGVIKIDKNIYKEGELSEEATCKEFLQVQTEGDRTVKV